MSHTPNFAMPLLFAAQAQKEITHNEALVLIDALLSGCVAGMVSDPGTLDPGEGNVWIVGPSPVGAWSGHAANLAIFTAGGWRFAPAVAGLRMYDRADTIVRTFADGAWQTPVSIADPAGGAVVDGEARAILAALLSALRAAGLLDAT